MKDFEDMTQKEIAEMSDENFKDVSPFKKKSCYDCNSLAGRLTLWCMNDEAFKARRTRMPGVIKCPFWQPNYNYIDEKYHPVSNGTIPEDIKKEMTISEKIRHFCHKLLFDIK